mmetsp:Transcript_75733/g.181025  ORF Transcript_75733/g.181025 Transcript_75733/m.181025 type:complete len:295 (+) Transcript_75733:738-1622(+)
MVALTEPAAAAAARTTRPATTQWCPPHLWLHARTSAPASAAARASNSRAPAASYGPEASWPRTHSVATRVCATWTPLLCGRAPFRQWTAAKTGFAAGHRPATIRRATSKWPKAWQSRVARDYASCEPTASVWNITKGAAASFGRGRWASRRARRLQDTPAGASCRTTRRRRRLRATAALRRWTAVRAGRAAALARLTTCRATTRWPGYRPSSPARIFVEPPTPAKEWSSAPGGASFGPARGALAAPRPWKATAAGDLWSKLQAKASSCMAASRQAELSPEACGATDANSASGWH